MYDKISKNFRNDAWMLETLFVVVPIGCGSFVFQFVSSSATILTRKIAGCFTLIIL